MTEDGKLMSSKFDLKDKEGDDVKYQKVTTGNYSLEGHGNSVRGGQTSKVMKYVVGEKPFDIHKVLPINEESLMKNIVNAGQIDLETLKNVLKI